MNNGKQVFSVGESIGRQRFEMSIAKQKQLGSARLALAVLKLQQRSAGDAMAQRNNLDAMAIHENTIERLTARVR